MKRRTFIQRLAGTGIVLPVTLGFPRLRAFAQDPVGSPFARLVSGTNDRIFILIRLAGGNDGLNTVVPYTNPTYYNKRDIDGLAIDANSVKKLPGSTTLGLHPNLEALLPLYSEGKMTVVQGVGYENQNLSHFRSTDIWLSGSNTDVYWNSGWYGRYLEAKYPDYPTTLPQHPFAIELGTYLSTTLIGESNNMGMAVSDLSYVPGQQDSDPVAGTHAGEEEAYVREIARQANIFSNAIIEAATRQLTNKVTYPVGNALALGLASIAKIIAGGLTTQLYIINVGGYDTHSNQLSVHGALMTQLAEAVAAFQRDLEAFGLDERVSMMTISEFGRRVASNGTGTDHGSAAPMLVFGTGVKGGIIGSDPDLDNLEGPGNMRRQYDFRQIYASVLAQWFGASGTQLAAAFPPPAPAPFEQLPIFESAASIGAPVADARGALELGVPYPNPVVSTATIPVSGVPAAGATLRLYTEGGRAVLTRDVESGQGSVALDVRSLPAGTYLYELRAGDQHRTARMTVVK